MGNTRQIDKRFAVKFIDLWNVSDGQDEVAKKIGMSYEQVKAYAALLRNRGYKLSNMTDRAWQVQPKYVPSLAEIRAECKRIQAGWSERERKQRMRVDWRSSQRVEACVISTADLKRRVYSTRKGG
jgi:hypothetical protein